MEKKTVNILGTEYKIEYLSTEEDEFLKDCDGYCDYTCKRIVIKSNNNNDVGDFKWLQKKQLRHELIHAMLSESGLESNFQHCKEFGHDETMIDWVAIQFPKLLKIYQELDIL